MDTVVAWILGIATVVGGVAAIGYFIDKWRAHRTPAVVTPPPPPIEKDKVVTSAWWDASDLRNAYIARGLEHFHWSNAESVPEREQQGYEVVCLFD